MLKISKKRIIITLIVLAAIGSVITFHATNLVLASILNKDCPFGEFFVGFFPSVSFLLVSFDFILALFFFYRLYQHPTHEQRLFHVYGIVLASFSGFGFLMTTLSGAITYTSFLVNYPFAGFHIIMYIFHILMLALAGLMIFYFPKQVINDDIIIHHTNTSYVFQNILLVFLVFVTLNRLGAFILIPTFIQWSSLALTYPAYVALILPTIIMVVDFIYFFGGFEKIPEAGIVLCAFVMFLSVFCCVQICHRGMSDQLFIQLISPINPIGRLLTFPVDAVLQMLVAFGLALYTLIDSVKFKLASDFEKLPYEIRMAKLEGRRANFLKAAKEVKPKEIKPKPKKVKKWKKVKSKLKIIKKVKK